MSVSLYLLFKELCGCRIYRNPYGFSLALCEKHKKEQGK